MENNYDKLVELFNKYGKNGDSSWYEMFYTNDYPIPYKGLVVYPVQVDLYYVFHSFVECLLLPHLTSGDINALQMSYFEYLIYLAEQKNQKIYINYLYELLSIVFKKPLTKADGSANIYIMKQEKKHLLIIENEALDEKDFDEIRKIICEQNAIELPDEETHPDILKAIKEVEEYKRKQAKIKMCSFEDQINIVVAKSSYRRDECIKMTIRSFTRLLERVDKIMHYSIMSLLSPNLTDEGRKNIEHYMAADKTRAERYKETMTEQDKINKEISKVNG